jgi:hypothetical protein
MTTVYVVVIDDQEEGMGKFAIHTNKLGYESQQTMETLEEAENLCAKMRRDFPDEIYYVKGFDL